jgi:anti-sigma factor RsiW
MRNERDIIHKILDGDAGDKEKELITRGMESDPALREEFTSLKNTVRQLKAGERFQPSASFTADVMRNLPRSSPSLLDRVKDFLLGSRVLRWNVASATALAIIAIVALIAVTRVGRESAMHVAGPTAPTVIVRLTFNSPQAHQVAVAGDFNKWKTDADEMKKTNGVWSIDLKLKPGVYTYSFIVDGKSWVPDPGAEVFQDDGFGSRNAVLRVNI